MGLRVSLILIIALSWASVGIVWFIKNPPQAESDPNPPYFYTLPSADLKRISISTTDNGVSWILNEDSRTWFFEEPDGIPVSQRRWGGITTLLGGPQTQRKLLDEIDDIAKYGLDDPQLSIRVLLKDQSEVGLDIGKLTPDNRGNYARLVGFPQLVMVDASWGQVLTRLITEPPFPEWYYSMDPNFANEVLFFENNEVVRGYSYSDDNDETVGWHLCDLPVEREPCKGTKPLDANLMAQILSNIANPRFVGVDTEALRLQDESDFEAYGAGLLAPYIFIRLEEEDSRNITIVNRVSISLGNTTADGNEMYVRVNDSDTVARVESEWGNDLLSLFTEAAPVSQP